MLDSCRVRCGSLGAVFIGCVLPPQSGEPNDAGRRVEQIRAVDSRGCVCSFSGGVTRGLVLKTPQGDKQYFQGGSLPCKVGHVDMCRYTLEKGCVWLSTHLYWSLQKYVSGTYYCSSMVLPQRKKRSVGTLGKKQADRDDVGRAGTRHVQI